GSAPDAFGRFTLAYALRDLTGQGGACGAAPLLSEARPFNATTAGATDKFATSCGGADTAASGPDKVYRLGGRARATVGVTVTGPGVDAGVAPRQGGSDGWSGDVELACESDADN